MNATIRNLGMAVCIACGFSSAFADEVTEQIESGLKAYNDKDYKTALDELKYAEALIQEMKNKENSTLLPEPLEGWDAKDVKTTSMTMAGGGTMMSRQYTRGKQTLKIEVAANSPLLGMMSMMIKNPMMMAGEANMKAYRYKRNKGMIETKNGRMETKLLLAGQILIDLELKDRDQDRLKTKGKEVIEAYLDKMDFVKIKEAFLQ